MFLLEMLAAKGKKYEGSNSRAPIEEHHKTKENQQQQAVRKPSKNGIRLILNFR